MNKLLFPPRFVRARLFVAIALLALVTPGALRAQGGDVADRIKASGLSPDQIRAKLKAAGYKEDVLNAYLGGTAPTAAPTKDVLAAVGALGAADRAEQAGASQAAIRNIEAASAPTTENGLPVFGLDIFRNASTQFDPSVAGPVDANYRLGPSDVVAVILTGQAELSHTLPVTRDGFIVIPTVGQIFVANLTLEMATKVIVQKLRGSYANISTDANAPTRAYVSVARLRTNQIFVIGDVASAGSYPVSAAGTAMTALYAAGGPTVNGTLRRIEVRRAGQVVSTLDVYDYLLRGDASKDVRLENGDVVFVAGHSRRVAITGEVRRSALFDLKDGETLADLVVAAGGLKATAGTARVQISRVLPPAQRREGRDRVVIDVPMDPESNAMATTPLQDADRVVVFSIVERVRDRIGVSGAVWQPGYVAFRPGMRLSQAIHQAGGARPDTYRDQILITRLQADESRKQIRSRIDSLGNPSPDVELQDADQITLFAESEFRTERAVSVAGAVRRPGKFEFVQKMTLGDVFTMAGGTLPEAYRQDVLITRVAPDGRRVQLRTSIDSLGRPFPDIELKSDDDIRLFAEPEFRTERSVSVGGAVRRPGKMQYTQNMTLSDVVTLVGGVEDGTDVIDTVSVSRLQPDMTRRVFSVPLKGPGGYNDFVLNGGDEVQVYARSSFRPSRTVSVGGDVNAAREMPFQTGLTLRQAILDAGGLQQSALLTEVEISRFPADRKGGKTAQIFRVPIDSTYLFEIGKDGKYLGPPGLPARVQKAPEFVLEPYDHVNVMRQPDWEIPGSVSLGGEVRYPGSYTIKNRNETIADVIARAGGLTEKAYPEGVDFRRLISTGDKLERQKVLDRVRRERSYVMAQERVQIAAAAAARSGGADANAAAGTEEAALLAMLPVETDLTERVGIDLPALLRNKGRRDNVKLRPGDQIFIPAYTPTITVRGFVNNPTAVLYKAGADLKYYINSAGGPASSGDVSRAFVHQPNGQLETVRNRKFAPDAVPTPRAGAIVVVPAENPKIVTTNSNLLPLVQAMAGIAAAAVGVIAILKR